jgi:threonine/homoserine/homoserine lactone efflux protein
VETSLSTQSIISLFSIMLIGAAIPGASVLTVTARSATYGFIHGLFVSLGILLGDIIFILLAIYGLSLLSGLLEQHFYLIKYIGALYLMWLGILLLRTPQEKIAHIDNTEKKYAATFTSSFVAGLLITLGDQKAILFYLAVFPALFQLARFSIIDTLTVISIAGFAILFTKLLYAWLADRTSMLFYGSSWRHLLHLAAGCVMIGVGVLLAVTA